MRSFCPSLMAVLLFVFTMSGSSQAAVTFNYDGRLFNDIIGPYFDGTNRVVGTVTFDSIGDATANSFSLSIDGKPGFTFNVPDTTSAPAGITVSANAFTWGVSAPATWNLSVFGDLVEGAGDEQISIGETGIGDLGVADGGSSIGAINNGGTWSEVAVPEPSSLMLAAAASGLLVVRRRRKS